MAISVVTIKHIAQKRLENKVLLGVDSIRNRYANSFVGDCKILHCLFDVAAVVRFFGYTPSIYRVNLGLTGEKLRILAARKRLYLPYIKDTNT